ncbi:glycoside hydrolase family 43 protein [Gordonia sp. TBRC 11910]|uniref:Glycoside hydrolase family 43 protein n=1 Tax=Gordonia asplenii TaxID=2725283 RepID=A0A848KUB4_9ACTN|nr:arabinofuranosidase [Gordonia asplenii]NMO02110.1 glycoside hydrolase family 43 protein [Gordonia asplenii]
MTIVRRSAYPVVTAALLTIAGLLLGSPASAGAAPTSPWRYTVVGFSNTSARDMDVYQSGDGTDYAAVHLGAYRPPDGYVRDPSIFRNSDGTYYVTYTTANGANIGFARSTDLATWTHITDYPVPFCCAFLPGTGDGKGPINPFGSSGSAGFQDGPSLSPFTTKAWAPDWFVEDGRVSIILSMSTGGGFMPYLMTALDSSFQRWSWPSPILSIGTDHIDTTIVKVGSTYHAFTKNETKKIIQHAVASSLAGPYRFVTPGKWGRLVEGPAVVQLPNGKWRLYLDAYTKGRYLYSDSADGLKTWSTPKELSSLSGRVRHIGVMREPS